MSYASTQAELAEHVRVQVAVGHADVDAIVEEAAYMFGVEEDAVRPLAETAQAKTDAAMATWPEVTACDRLDAAFAALDRAGIRARQHFACCNTCGHYEMTEDIHAARDLREAQIDGYVFYHRQDADTAVTEGVLHLRYATVGGDDATSAAIGRRVEAALRAAGLEPTWEGDSAKTIQLRGFRWQRRSWLIEGDPSPPGTLAAWCAAFERTAPAEFVVALGEPFLHALAPDLAVRFARAASTAPFALTPRAQLLGSLARVHGDRALWREALACCALRQPTIVELILDLDVADPTLRELARLRISEMRRNALQGAASAWFAVRTGDAGDHLLYTLRRHLGSDEDAPSAKLAIRAALWALGDDAMRAGVVDPLTTSARYGLDPYAITVGARAAQLRGCMDDHAAIVGPSKPVVTSVAEAEARVATLTEGYEEGLYTEAEVEAGRYELALVQRDFAGLAARYRDEQRARCRALREHLEAVREGTAPRIVTVDPVWLDGSRDKTIARNVGTWQTLASRDERWRQRRVADRVLLAAISIASVDRARAVALVDAILDGNDDMIRADAVIPALLAIGELDRAVARAETGYAGPDGLGPLITALARAGRVDDARARLAEVTLHLFCLPNVLALATATVAVADDPRVAATTMLAAWDRAEAAVDELCGLLATRT